MTTQTKNICRPFECRELNGKFVLVLNKSYIDEEGTCHACYETIAQCYTKDNAKLLAASPHILFRLEETNQFLKWLFQNFNEQETNTWALAFAHIIEENKKAIAKTIANAEGG